jgi:poly(A) polymerase Pap1
MNLDLTSTVNVEDLTNIIKINANHHKKMYEEAVTGWRHDTEKKIRSLLDRLTSPMDISISIPAPKDYSDVYETALNMLTWTTDKTIKLDADSFRNLVMDEWDWSKSWIFSNARYSSTVEEYGKAKKIL